MISFLALLCNYDRENCLIDLGTEGPINRLLNLLESGTLRGIGDVISPESLRESTDIDQFDRFFAEHKARRLPGEIRSEADSLFHYKIDAVNNCLTLAASNSKEVCAPFVTPTPLNIRQCTVAGHAYGRMERTPLFLLNAHRMREEGVIGDEIEFLTTAANDCVQVAEKLRIYNNLQACPVHLQLRLVRIYQDYISFLNRAKREEQGDASEDTVEEILETVSDRKKLEDLLDDARQDIRDGATLIELHKTSFDLPYVEQFDFSDDPILARIKRELGVSLKQ